MEYISRGEVVDSFDEKTHFNVSANGEEHRLLGAILDLVQKSVVNAGVCPPDVWKLLVWKKILGGEALLS